MTIKKLLLFTTTTILLISITGCKQPSLKQEVTTQHQKQLIIDIDKELKSQSLDTTRGDSSLILEKSLYIGDNDEVIIKGNFLIEKSPIFVKIGNHEETSFHAKEYHIPTFNLKGNNLIQLSDKNKELFLELEIIK